MRCFRLHKSGVLISVFIAAIGMSLLAFSDQTNGPREDAKPMVSFQPPVEERVTPIASEGQYQMQLLQKEIMDLRGQVEVLEHDLGRLKATQDDRYLDLDARLQQLLTTFLGAFFYEGTSCCASLVLFGCLAPFLC